MALAGEAAVCIWNDITPEKRDEFYSWHIQEHMPERVGIPGFRRGRRYIAVDTATQPEYFTLYEVDSYEVLVGQDYLNRLNAPTPWTLSATSGFRNTMRALTRVRASEGRGPGGILATLRFLLDADTSGRLTQAAGRSAIAGLVDLPQITGAHLCLTDQGGSAVRTNESRHRKDIQEAPDGAVLVEGCNEGPVRAAAEAAMRQLEELGAESIVLGMYRLEHVRLKAAHSPG